MDAKTRRLEINLLTLGTGIALLGIWTMIRTGLTFFIFDDEVAKLVEPGLKLPVYIVAVVFIGLIVLCQCYIGLSARAEGKGRHRRAVYLVFSGILLFAQVLFVIVECVMMFTPSNEGIVSMIASFIIDLTTTACLTELMASSIRLRRIRNNAPADVKGGSI